MEDNFMALSRVLDLLEQKGFTEKGLNLDWKPGTIASGVKRQFNLLNKSTLTDKPLNVLVAEIPGLFDKAQDRVDYTLTFQYNAKTDKARLRFVKATMSEDIKKLYIIGNPQKMYNIMEMYHQLNEKRSNKALKVFLQIAEKRLPSKTKHL